MPHTALISDYKTPRTFIPEDFVIEDWEGLRGYYEYLLEQNPNSLKELEAFLLKENELAAVIYEEMGWRYIRKSCNTQDEALLQAFQKFVTEIAPEIRVYEDKINRKVVGNPYFKELDENFYGTYTRALRMQIELFREENIPLVTEEQSVSQEFGTVNGAMTITYKGETLTLPQAGRRLEDTNRSVRKEVWKKVQERRDQDQDTLMGVFDRLISIRSKIAQNAGFDTFTDFQYKSLDRFDYTQKEVRSLHDSIEKVITPIYKELMEERKERLGVEKLRPWDLKVSIFGSDPLQPFTTSEELIAYTVEGHKRLQSRTENQEPALGTVISLMDKLGFLDLESRVGKAPGGYNYPLMEAGVPFIFMNATGTHNDLITMLHESGHALHAFLTRDISLIPLKRAPSEIAELAAMTMELLVLDDYDIFYEDPSMIARAKKEQLLRCVLVMPWIATVDAFQHWVYAHPEHTHAERTEKWKELYYRYHGDTIDWTGYEKELGNMWLRQLHIFEVPFYYIEYAFAQLGALAIWRNYNKDAKKGLAGYLEALRLGYTKTIPEVYQTAGINFDFSEEYVREVMTFCREAYHELKIPVL